MRFAKLLVTIFLPQLLIEAIEKTFSAKEGAFCAFTVIQKHLTHSSHWRGKLNNDEKQTQSGEHKTKVQHAFTIQGYPDDLIFTISVLNIIIQNWCVNSGKTRKLNT